jgi:hypothetical protein
VPEIAVPFFFHTYVGAAPPLVGVAVNVILAPAHIAPVGDTVADTLGVGIGFTVIVMSVDVASVGLAQPELLIIFTCTLSPFANAAFVYVAFVLAAPWLVLFKNHSNVGAVPPLPGLAVKVTDSPAHIGFLLAAIVTAGVTTVVTVIVIPELVAVVGLAQIALLVIVTVYTSPFTAPVVVYVALVAPAIAVPFFFHTYVGAAPPLVTVDVNVMLVPEQIVVLGVAIVTLGVTLGVTVTVTSLVNNAPHPPAEISSRTKYVVAAIPDGGSYVALVAPAIFVYGPPAVALDFH